MIEKTILLAASVGFVWFGLIYSIAQFESQARTFKDNTKAKQYDELSMPTLNLIESKELLAPSFVTIGVMGLSVSIPLFLGLETGEGFVLSIMLMAVFFFTFAKALKRMKLKIYLKAHQLNTVEEIRGAMSTWLRPKGTNPLDKLDDSSAIKKAIMKHKK